MLMEKLPFYYQYLPPALSAILVSPTNSPPHTHILKTNEKGSLPPTAIMTTAKMATVSSPTVLLHIK
jgi:hypothetical protein